MPLPPYYLEVILSSYFGHILGQQAAEELRAEINRVLRYSHPQA